MGVSTFRKYHDPAKQEAREAIWKILSTERGGLALSLPGAYRLEADTAIRCGFPLAKQLFAEFSDEPKHDPSATMSNFTRKFSARELKDLEGHRHVGWLSDVSKNLAAEGVRIQAAHLDFCKPIETIQRHHPRVEIEKFILSGIMENGLLAITVLNGRVAGFEGTDTRRKMLYHAVNMRLKTPAEEVGWGTYWNEESCSPMLWTIHRIKNNTRGK